MPRRLDRSPHPQMVISAHGTAARALGLSAVQLQGDRAADVALEAAKEINVVVQVVVATDLAEMAVPVGRGGRVLMVDAPNPGGGKPFDWALVGDHVDHHRVLLAGGLNPGNVAAVIREVGPGGVDVAAGVDHLGGGKDRALRERFVAAARTL